MSLKLSSPLFALFGEYGEGSDNLNESLDTVKYEVIPHDGDASEIYHAHSTFSDGKDSFEIMLKEALLLELDFYAPMDHLDFTGISGQVHQGPWMGNFADNMEYRREFLDRYLEQIDEDLPEDESHTLKVGRGAEIDWDPRAKERDILRKGVKELDLDYDGLSVHYDENGVGFKSPNIIQDAQVDEKVNEYVDELLRAVDFGKRLEVDCLCHPGRAEEGVLGEGIEKETYYPVLDSLADSSMAYELNPKVHLRYLLNNGELPAEFYALAEYGGELPDISIGTDTHRVGHSSSYEQEYDALKSQHFPQIEEKVTESQMRLKYAEQLLQRISEIRNEEVKPFHILEGKDLTEVTVKTPINNIIERAR